MNGKNRKEIRINEQTHGIAVYAKSLTPRNKDWILLIKDTKKCESLFENRFLKPDLEIYTHVSIPCSNIKTARIRDELWGKVKRDRFVFYEATAEEIELIKNALKKENKKFVKVLNQVIDR